MSERKISYKPNEMLQLLKDTILANDLLIAKGEIPVSIGIVGKHGIGKSEISKQAAIDLGRPFYKLNVGQLTEPAELIGHFQKECLVIKEDQNAWIPENLIPKFIENGFNYVGRFRTVACPPEWVDNLEEGAILVFDDVTRGNQLIMQSMMELINSHEMIGWDLKSKKVQIILNENPQEGNYNVTTVDEAYASRYAQANMIWCHKSWAEWAEKRKVNNNLINFVLWKPEIFEEKSKDGIPCGGIAPRMMDKFFNLIQGFENLESNMDKIVKFGNITVGIDTVNEMKEFIKGKLDKLPTAEELITKMSLKEAKKRLTEVCGVEGNKGWNDATAMILAIRSYNYVRFAAKNLTDENIKQYLELVLHTSFGNDQKYVMITNVLDSIGESHSIFFDDNRISDIIMDCGEEAKM